VEWVIEVKNLVKDFNGKRVLHGITFQVVKGDLFGYLGPNGAGKTTTIKILLGLLKPTSGKALVLGEPLAKNSKIRSRIGVILESDGLFARFTAFENLDFYAKIYGLKNNAERKRRIMKLLELVNLYEYRNVKVGHFSRGMKRRLAFARALINNPRVLLLDEPTSGLDPEARNLVRNLLTKLSKEEKITIFLTSHDLNEIQKICSRVAILMNGKILAIDTIDNLIKNFSEPLVEISFIDENESQRVYEYLKNLTYVIDCKRYGEKISVILNKDQSKLLQDLLEINARIREITKPRKTLEEVYLELVRRGC